MDGRRNLSQPTVALSICRRGKLGRLVVMDRRVPPEVGVAVNETFPATPRQLGGGRLPSLIPRWEAATMLFLQHGLAA